MVSKVSTVFLLLLLASVVRSADRADAAARWREDIDFMVKGLSARGMTIDLARGPSSRGQKDFAKLYPPATFDPAIKSLKERLPQLTDADVVLELMRIVAGARVAHNNIGIPGSMGFEKRLPMTFRWYADGLAIIAATAAHRDVIGCRVRAIGSTTPEQFVTAVRPFIAQENDVWVRSQSARMITLQPVLARLGLLDTDGSVVLTLDQPPSGSRVARVPFTTEHGEQESFRKVRAVPPVVYASGPNRLYWHRYLEDSRTMFIQYNGCHKDPKLPMSEFARVVGAELGTRPADRVVLDMRWNSGGDSRVINPLTDALLSHPRWKGRVYVLIGQGTFSSAVHNAIELKNRGAVLIGERTDGTPSGYGEVKTLTLPHSKLLVRFTSKFFRAPKGLDTDALQPDIAAPMAFVDVLAGRDAGLEAAVAAK